MVTLCMSQSLLLVFPLELLSDEHDLSCLMRPGGEAEGRVVSSASVWRETPLFYHEVCEEILVEYLDNTDSASCSICL